MMNSDYRLKEDFLLKKKRDPSQIYSYLFKIVSLGATLYSL